MTLIKRYLERLRDEASYYRFQFGRGKRYQEIICLDLRGKRVLEAGCGYGGIVSAFNGILNAGMDIDKKLITRASILSENPRTVFIIGDATSMPYKDETFDVVLLLDVIEHVGDPEKLFTESARVLKKGGTICVNFASYRTAFGGHLILPYIHFLPKTIAYFLVGRLLKMIQTPESKDLFDLASIRRQHETLNRISTGRVSEMFEEHFTVENESVTLVFPYVKAGRTAALIPDFLCVSRLYICKK